MQIDVLIIGQGICGTFLSWYLEKLGLSCVVLDRITANSASRIASGVINPVTGRRIVKTWMIDELIPFLGSAYTRLGNELQLELIEQKEIIDFFPTPQMKLAFEKKLEEDSQYLRLPSDPHEWEPLLRTDFGFGIISPAFLVNLQNLIPAYRSKLEREKKLVTEVFEITDLKLAADHIQYRDIIASKIIFCDGIFSAGNPYFKNLPFALNKGEALLVEIEDLPSSHIYKKGFSLIPWKENIFWLGSSYLWEFENDQPTAGFLQFGDSWLKQTIRSNYRIVEHMAAIRPATLERRPFVGFHPKFPAVGILNGMGTKGCSLAPFFAKQLAEHISLQTPLLPEASIDRFRRILSA
jgi:glycine/D-amino acid oxidase-like deaminating enzyme